MKACLVEVARLARAENRPFLVIGGMCVTLYGVERLTRDIDLLIPEAAMLDWRLMLERLGYRFIHGTAAFQQFEGLDREQPLPDLDLMLVDETTWRKLSSVAREYPLATGVSVDIPDPLHYVAMKLKASRSAHRRADNQDWSDVLNVFRLFDLTPQDAQTREIVLRYGGDEALARLLADLPRMP